MVGFEIEQQVAIQLLAIGPVFIDAAHAASKTNTRIATLAERAHVLKAAFDFPLVDAFHVGQLLDRSFPSLPAFT